RGAVRHVLADHRLSGPDPGALHGHRPGAHDAAVLREQRHLSHRDHALLAAGTVPPEPADLRGGWAAGTHAGRRDERVWTGIRRARAAGRDGSPGGCRRGPVPTAGDVSRATLAGSEVGACQMSFSSPLTARSWLRPP